MPALTHGRVVNGFNQYARSITYSKKKCGGPGICCGKPLQPTKYNVYTKGRNSSRIRNRENPKTDRAISLGGIGSRSFGTRRAIARRVQNRNQMPKKSGKFWLIPSKKGYDTATGITTIIGAESDTTVCCSPTITVL